MKCTEFKAFLSQLCRALSRTGAGGTAAQLQALYPVLDAQPNKSVASVVTKLGAHGSLKQSEIAGADYALSDLDEFRLWYVAFGKPAVAKDLNALLGLLRTLRVSEVHDFASGAHLLLLPPAAQVAMPPREDVVSRYCERLEAALGDNKKVSSIVEELRGEVPVKTNELLLIAKRFGFTQPKSRPAALKKIWSRHQAILTSQARTAATGGRVAG